MFRKCSVRKCEMRPLRLKVRAPCLEVAKVIVVALDGGELQDPARQVPARIAVQRDVRENRASTDF
jgi:hypothetical protein